MGTRSTTAIKRGNKESETICTFYRQFDGYICGHGFDLRDGFGHTKIINGYNNDHKVGTHANGMGCLAAQVIARLKDEFGIGGIYMIENGNRQEYNYMLYIDKTDDYQMKFDEKLPVYVEVSYDDGKVIYDGLLSELEEKNEEDDEEDEMVS